MAGHLTEDDILSALDGMSGDGRPMSFASGGSVDTDDLEADLEDQRDDAQDQAEDDQQDQEGMDQLAIPAAARPTQQSGMSDEQMGLSDAQMQGGQSGGMSDEQMGISDEDMDLEPPRKQDAGDVFQREALHELPSAVATLPFMGAGAAAGAEVGGALGTFAIPIPGLGTLTGAGLGALVGGVGGALGGGYLTSKIMDYLYEKAGLKKQGAYFDPQKMAEGAEQHSVAAALGDVGANLAGFRYNKAATAGARVAGALLQTGLEGGQEASQGELDPVRLALAAASGAAFTEPNKFGSRMMSHGERFIPRSTEAGGSDKVSGRPNVPVDQDIQAERDNVDANDVTTVARGVAAENPPVNTDVDVGSINPPVRSERQYPKTGTPGEYSFDENTLEIPPWLDRNKALSDAEMNGTKGLNVGEGVRPDVQSALEAARPDVQNSETPEFNKQAPEVGAVNRLDENDLLQTSRDQRQRLSDVQNAGRGELPADAFDKIPSNARPTEFRAVKGDEQPPGPVYPHPELPDLQVDRTKMVPRGADIAPDGKTLFVDSRLPPLIDVGGKKLDPSLPLGVRAKVFHDVYNGPGVTKDMARDASRGAEAAWLQSRGYDPVAYRAALRNTIEGPQARPGDAVIAAAMKATEKMPKVRERLMGTPDAEKPQVARRILELMSNARGKAQETYATARIPSKAATVEGTGVTARTKAEAAKKQAVVKAAQEAFDKFATPEGPIPTSVPDKQALRSRLQMAVEHVQRAGEYRPRDLSSTPAIKWVLNAKRLLNGKMTPKQIAKFIADEKLLRTGNREDARAVTREGSIEGNLAMRGKRPTVEAAEAQAANEGREIDWANLSDADLEDMAKAKNAADASISENVKQQVPAWKKAEEERSTKMAEQKAKRLGQITATVKDFTGDERGSVGGALPVKGAKGQTRMAMHRVMNELDYERVLRGEGHYPNEFWDTPAGKAAILERAQSKTNITKRLISDFFANEQGGSPPAKPLEVVSEGANNLYRWLRTKPSEDWRASFAKSPEEKYARSIDDRLYQVDKQIVDFDIKMQKHVNSWPEEMRNQKTMNKIYRAIETQNDQFLNAKEKQFKDTQIVPMNDQARKIAEQIAKIDPDFAFDPDAMYIHRIPEYTYAALAKEYETSPNPFGSSRRAERSLNMITAALKERSFMELVDANGNRKVVSENDKHGGFDIWKSGQSHRVKDPQTPNGEDFEFKKGEVYRDSKGHDWTLQEAITPNIERHARFRNGKMAKYIQNAGLSVIKANSDLNRVWQHMKMFNDLTQNDPVFKELTTRSDNEAKDQGWPTEKAKLFPFDKFYMHPELKAVFDHYAQPGFEGDMIDKWRNLSRGVTKLMFWLPTAHAINVADHWFVARGWDWMNPVAYQRLAATSARAIKSVVAQDEFQSMLRDNGAATIYGGVLNENFLRNIAREVGEDMTKRNPTKWDPIVNTLGLDGARDLAHSIYDASSRVMWAVNDMFLTQHIMEQLDHGVPLKDAIVKAERHIPNYRVPVKVLSSGDWGKFASKVISDPGYTAFGRYHYGVFNSYAHIVKSMVNGTPEQRKEAIGNLMAMGILAFAIKPVLDKAAQYITGNKEAESRARGPIALPYHFVQAIRGKEEPQEVLKSAVTVSPIVTTTFGLYNNEDFAKRNIIEPAAVRGAFKKDTKFGQRMRDLGTIGVQGGEYAARNLVAPYGTLANAYGRGQGALASIRNQALDIKEPSQKSLRWQNINPRREQSEMLHRRAPGRGRGPAEDIYNRLTR